MSFFANGFAHIDPHARATYSDLQEYAGLADGLTFDAVRPTDCLRSGDIMERASDQGKEGVVGRELCDLLRLQSLAEDVRRAVGDNDDAKLKKVLEEHSTMDELLARLCEPSYGYCPECARGAVHAAAELAYTQGVLMTLHIDPRADFVARQLLDHGIAIDITNMGALCLPAAKLLGRLEAIAAEMADPTPLRAVHLYIRNQYLERARLDVGLALVPNSRVWARETYGKAQPRRTLKLILRYLAETALAAPDALEEKHRGALYDTLVNEHGYCYLCAHQTVELVKACARI